jgi:hypothetical protein
VTNIYFRIFYAIWVVWKITGMSKCVCVHILSSFNAAVTFLEIISKVKPSLDEDYHYISLSGHFMIFFTFAVKILTQKDLLFVLATAIMQLSV